ncbi:unnamed protein product [Closterium sp. NIES-65]|nr:unnamed protein product [Closterium sp. NIES-65]
MWLSQIFLWTHISLTLSPLLRPPPPSSALLRHPPHSSALLRHPPPSSALLRHPPPSSPLFRHLPPSLTLSVSVCACLPSSPSLPRLSATAACAQISEVTTVKNGSRRTLDGGSGAQYMPDMVAFYYDIPAFSARIVSIWDDYLMRTSVTPAASRTTIAMRASVAKLGGGEKAVPWVGLGRGEAPHAPQRPSVRWEAVVKQCRISAGWRGEEAAPWVGRVSAGWGGEEAAPWVGRVSAGWGGGEALGCFCQRCRCVGQVRRRCRSHVACLARTCLRASCSAVIASRDKGMIAKLATGFTPGPDDAIIDVTTVNPQWGDIVGEWHAVVLETTSHWRVVPDAPRLIFTNDDWQTLNGVDPYMAHARALKTIANFFEARRQAGKAFPVPFFMTAPPQHSAKKIGGSGVCGSPGRVLNDKEIEKMLRTNVQLSRYWPMQRAAFPGGSAVRRFDITLVSAYRPEAHCGIYSKKNNVRSSPSSSSRSSRSSHPYHSSHSCITRFSSFAMLPPVASPSARALNGERFRCANSCGLSLLAAARPASLVPARAALVSAVVRASARVRATAGQGSGPKGRSEGRKLSQAAGRWAEGFEAEERRGEGERWGAETQSQRQGEWRIAQGRKAGSKGSRQRVAGYADDVASEDRLRQEAGGAVDWLTRPSNGDAGAQSVRNGEWDTGRGRENGAADWGSGWDGDGEEQGVRGQHGGWGEGRGGAEGGRAGGVEGWMGDGNVERVRRVGAEGRCGDAGEGWEARWRAVECDAVTCHACNWHSHACSCTHALHCIPRRPTHGLLCPSSHSLPHALPPSLPLSLRLSLPHSLAQVVACMGSPLDWLQRFVLSMGGAVLLYNVNVFATIAAAMYFLWWPLWHAAACNSALRVRYKYAGVWQAQLLDVQVEQRGPLARWRLLIGDDSGTCIEMLVPIPSVPPPLRPNDRVVLLVLSDSPSLQRFRAVREVWLPRLKCWLAEEGAERVERRVLEGF